MGDTAKAIELMTQMNAKQDSSAAAPTDPSPPAVVTPVVDPTAKLAALRERRAAQRASVDYGAKETALKTQQTELARVKEELAAEKAKWEAAYKDPVEGFAKLGLKPEQVLQRIHDKLVTADTPEAKERALLEMIQEQTQQKFNPQIEELKKSYAATKAELDALKSSRDDDSARLVSAQKTAREAEFVKTLSSPEYDDLHDFYDQDKLVQMGYFYGKMLHDAGQPYDYESCAKKIVDEHKAWWDNVEKRRQSKAQSKSPEKSQVRASRQEEVPAAIGNDTASAVASGDTRKMSRDERLKKATRDLVNVKLTTGTGR